MNWLNEISLLKPSWNSNIEFVLLHRTRKIKAPNIHTGINEWPPRRAPVVVHQKYLKLTPATR